MIPWQWTMAISKILRVMGLSDALGPNWARVHSARRHPSFGFGRFSSLSHGRLFDHHFLTGLVRRTSIACFVLASSFAFHSSAADLYVRQGATGDGSGRDWANAYPNFPASLSRGNTYYVADGSYAGDTFDTPTSGTTVITIKKATVGDHGTDTGWSSSYGDGQAQFGPLSFTTKYWVLDGATRTGPKSGHGIVITTGSNTNPSSKGIRLNGSGNITIRYVEIAGHGPDGDGGGNDLIYASSAVDNVTIQYCYLRDAGRVHLLSRGGRNWVLEHSVMYKNESVSSEHAESWSPGRTSDVIVRFNLFEETRGTGIIATLDNHPGPDNWEIYGNVFLSCVSNNGAITTDSESSWTNVKVYNNTFANGTGYAQGLRVDQGSGASWEVHNNIWYNNASVRFSAPDTLPHDYNWFYQSGTQSEAHIQNGTGDPFVDLKNGNLRLSGATNAGIAIALSQYKVDMDGNTRGSDGGWDRGAYEFGPSSNPPSPPQNLTVTVK
ncbi:MAG: right-handed parallel beta-helix repeat-containing protein [Bryobacterales bacterium]|nr:right-handed parallel beta-helix repeat-containing protein [Bryobacterales bacterium]